MNMFARFDENPAMTLQDVKIKETKRYGRTYRRMDGQHENCIPTTNKVCGGYNNNIQILGMNMLFISSSEAKNAYFMSGEATNETYIFSLHNMK